MLVVNTYGTLIHIILEDNKRKYRIPINGVTTNKKYEGYKLSSWGYNKKIKWLYK